MVTLFVPVKRLSTDDENRLQNGVVLLLMFKSVTIDDMQNFIGVGMYMDSLRIKRLKRESKGIQRQL